jgi:hypothetical protein
MRVCLNDAMVSLQCEFNFHQVEERGHRALTRITTTPITLSLPINPSPSSISYLSPFIAIAQWLIGRDV